jgi:myo-inositol-1(or 4)-monophosphatase
LRSKKRIQMTTNNLIEQVSGIVREASRLMVREGFAIHEKGSVENIVTSSDLAVQDFLTERLAQLLPGCGFLCEEEDLTDLKHAYVWIIDPIDGTANYARGSENCCISVALVHQGTPVAGVVYSPWRDELYTAEKGRGACCNGKPIHASTRSFKEGIRFTAMSTYRKEFARTCSDIIYDIYMECNDLRRTGSAAVELCLMARGFAELYFEMRLMPWDYAAAGLILEEAGGAICSLDGKAPSLTKPSLIIAGNNQENCDRILATVRKHLLALPY